MTTLQPIATMSTSAIMGASLGVRIDAAADVLSARNLVEIERQLPVAKAFARSHRFALPLPDAKDSLEIADQFREETAPQFTIEMREVFSRQLEREFVNNPSFRDIERLGLLDANIPAAMLAGLITFNQAFCTLNKIGLIIDGEIERMPSPLSERNPYLTAGSFLRRAAFDGLVLGAGMLGGAEMTTMLWVLAGVAPAVEVLSFLRGRGRKMSALDHNRERRLRLNELRDLGERIKDDRMRVIGTEERGVPSELVRRTVRMRQAMLDLRLEERPGSAHIVRDYSFLQDLLEEPLKYAVVVLPDEGVFEMRITDIDTMHGYLVLDDDIVVGAGYMRLETDDEGAETLLVDGKSTTWETGEEGIRGTPLARNKLAESTGLKEVKRAIEGLDGFAGSVELVRNALSH